MKHAVARQGDHEYTKPTNVDRLLVEVTQEQNCSQTFVVLERVRVVVIVKGM